MPINILMPALSPTMEEGTLAKWLVKEGDQVTSGAIIAEIETDKATMEFEAVDEGTVGKIVVAEGTEGVKVNDLIAVLLEEGESADAHRSGTGEAERAPSLRRPKRPPLPRRLPRARPRRPRQHRRAAHASSPRRSRAVSPPRRVSTWRRSRASGPNGRIVKADVEVARPAAPTPQRPAPAAPAAAAAEPPPPARPPRRSRSSTPTASSRRSSSTACARRSPRA